MIQRLVRALRLGRPRPGGGGAGALGRRRAAAAPRARPRRGRAVPRPARGAPRGRAPARARRSTRAGPRAGPGAVRVENVSVEAVAADDPGHEALAHAPIVHTRKGSLDRFSDAPLVAWVETFPAADGGRELRYSIVFSHEDGGTPLDRLMATWGRATDIELVYAVELDAVGTRAPGRVPGQGPRDDGVRRPARGPPPRAVRRHQEQHGERPRARDAARGARSCSLLARRRLTRGGDGRPPLDVRGLRGRGEARGPGRGRGRAGLEADPGPAPLRLPRGLRRGDRQRGWRSTSSCRARTAHSRGTRRTRDARPSASRAPAASAPAWRCRPGPR